ncbi:hypothetical protein BO79DRAFT_208481 [Aspergillus costaricaensis CBS 115574]|uniref:Uncharacterized protein n=1 Tax=Aspergillus costaricaensis CBS 115574 TaxID=1448317 RepID=A0ACD1IIJ7_9EURO|nr:hypothetical protein BO79DRAFT_208481 [Aspergillus costaricaensis CBS 115574]RAK90275.1 hypothetical protein BO79DRAFT_208481 [Aspergillus costaricaensis CBS 115574]
MAKLVLCGLSGIGKLDDASHAAQPLGPAYGSIDIHKSIGKSSNMSPTLAYMMICVLSLFQPHLKVQNCTL